jgi:hypothetical protein
VKAQLYILITIITLYVNSVYAQTSSRPEFSTAIEDNSMFIEEAYNQEDRVVQHISNLVFLPNLEDNYYYTFTQEWPAFGLKHQLSYTLQYNWMDKGSSTGPGDILLNYRYQLWYKQDVVACSPRLSLIIPSGDKNKGMGGGSWGLQANLPVSKRWTNHFINHFNAGATYLFKVEQDEIHYKKSLVSYFAGFSSIWLLTEKFNLMLEYLANFNASPGNGNKAVYTSQSVIAPAIRYAIDIKGLQIVPGLSLPFTLQHGSKTEAGGFIYLSFEHMY